ncbi:hypothetical protein [Streptomyces liliifuscus]|uniref:Uncharacterized protein n=1 Tax=Streptomyces liliifuscus TaxID=2797636 RepID=A0A7T7KX82_9ACTN|nr:hypothetical protein [Streptomyces liliifuscus]QQM41988.1 hypothetical protein JEQ17_22775 [Streptomyces liliifuscus]
MHAERIRARTEVRADEEPGTTAGQSTAERIAARILPGYRRDEELRAQARMGELRARGVISAADEAPDEDEEYEVVDEEEIDEDDVEEDDEPVSTAERYARRERQRQQAEHQATLAAHRGRAPLPQVGHVYAAQLAQPHLFAHGRQNPGS